jgi:hypothetical protein
METDDPAFKFRLRFDIYSMAPDERGVPQIEEDPSLLDHRCMYRIRMKLGHYLTWYGFRSGKGRRYRRNIKDCPRTLR